MTVRILATRSLRDANPLAPRSVLLVDAEPGALADRLDWRPGDDGLRAPWSRLDDLGIPRARFPAQPPAPAALAGRWPALSLAAHLALHLLHDAEPVPPVARVLDASPARLRLSIACEEHALALRCWLHAARVTGVLLGLPDDGDGALADEHARLARALRVLALNQLSLPMVREAIRRGVPWRRVWPGSQFVLFGHGHRALLCDETVPQSTSRVGQRIAGDKAATDALLAQLGCPTPGSRLCPDADDAVRAAEEIGYPVVVKPRDGSKGRHVAVGLADAAEVRAAWQRAVDGGAGGVLVQRVVPGDDHRLLVVDGRLVAAARREPASVTGDGASSVRALVDALNRDPRRGRGYDRLMEQVDLDHEALAQLHAQGLSPDAVPAAGRRVRLRATANVSRGGTAVDVTGRVHPDNRAIAERVARLVGLDVAGIDFQSPDIARPWHENGAAILEVNSNPGLRPHWIADPSRDVVGPVFDRLFPPGAPSRIPVVCVAGGEGRVDGLTASACTAAIARLLAVGVGPTGRASAEGLSVGDELRAGAARAGLRAASVGALLADPDLHAAALEIDAVRVVDEGMGLDAASVAVLLGPWPSGDAHGAGARREALRVVAGHARDALVLDADDPGVLAQAGGAPAQTVVLVSLRGRTPAIDAHLATGGRAVHLDGDGVLHLDAPAGGRGRVERLPADPALAFAAAVGLAMGLALRQVAAALHPAARDAQGDAHPDGAARAAG